jgi:hypothetical protein
MAKLRLHQSISVDGYVTQHHFLRGQDARELERRVGYGAGRLKDGFYLLFLNRVPKPDEFELKGYSHLPGGKPVGATDDAEAHLKAGHFDIEKLKLLLIKSKFTVSGSDRLAKILPFADGSSYPPGSGIPQWRLTKKLPCIVAAVIEAGGKCP